MLRCPADRHIRTYPDTDPKCIENIDKDAYHINQQCRLRIARSRHAEEENKSRYRNQIRGKHHPKRRHRTGNQIRIIRVDAQYQFRKQGDQNTERQNEIIANPYHTSAQTHHLFRLSGTNQIADQRTGSRSKGIDKHKKERRNTSHHIRNR